MVAQTVINRLRIRLGLDREWWLILVAGGLGVVMGTAAIGFILPVRWLENLPEFVGQKFAGLSQVLVLLAPCVGALLTVFVFWLFTTNFRGHGVTRVMLAVNREQSNLPMRIGIRHWLASTCPIGLGGSAGPEGPIVTIGSTVGSNISRWLKGDSARAATLLGCGSAAGLAAVFNAPLAAIFFNMEVILRDFWLRTFTPIVIASVVSAATAQMWLESSESLFGGGEEFFANTSESFAIGQIFFYVVFGFLSALIAVAFTRCLPISEKQFLRIPVHPLLRPLIGAILLGGMGAAWISLNKSDSGYPPFLGVGYAATRSYNMMLPLMLTAVIAALASRLLNRDSIYTAELASLGIRLGGMSDLSVLRRLYVSNIPLDTAITVSADDEFSKVLGISAEHGVDDFVVLHRNGVYRGMVTSNDLRQALLNRQVIGLLSVGEVTRDDLPVIYINETLDVVLDRFSRHDVQRLTVLSRDQPAKVLGLLSRASLMNRYQRELDAS